MLNKSLLLNFSPNHPAQAKPHNKPHPTSMFRCCSRLMNLTLPTTQCAPGGLPGFNGCMPHPQTQDPWDCHWGPSTSCGLSPPMMNSIQALGVAHGTRYWLEITLQGPWIPAQESVACIDIGMCFRRLPTSRGGGVIHAKFLNPAQIKTFCLRGRLLSTFF